MALAFIAGSVVGGIMASIIVYFYLKGMCEKKVMKAYNLGFEVASEKEKRAILDYIEQLSSDPNACIFRDESSKGSDA